MPRLPALLLLFILPALAACQHYDKAAHFAAGAGVPHVVSKETGSKAAGCAAAIGIGSLKEAIDHQADPADVIATGLGCVVTLDF